MLPSGRQPLFSNCVAWAVTHLAQVGLLDRPARGVTQIRVRSSEVLDRYKDHVDMKVLRHFPDGPELAVLMIKHHCGVIVEESFVLKQVDENLFEEA